MQLANSISYILILDHTDHIHYKYENLYAIQQAYNMSLNPYTITFCLFVNNFYIMFEILNKWDSFPIDTSGRHCPVI